MRRLALIAIALTAGCNAILDIPERTLLVDEDTAADVTFAVDSSTDTTIEETAAIDSAIEDTFDANIAEEPLPADTGMGVDSNTDEVATDTLVIDSAADTTLTDSTEPDTRDSAVADSARADTRDSAVADADTADTAAPDTFVPTCGVTGKPCCGSPEAAICDTNSVCASSTKMCIAAAGSCVRASDCPGVCTGAAICAGNVCFSCGASSGSGGLWDTCTSSSECKFGPCDRIRSVCSTACAPGITGDADCTALDPKAICTAPSWTVTSGTTMASGIVGFCARGCKSDSACRVAESCRIVGNNVMARLDLTCSPSPSGASVDTGGVCTGSNQCKRGACVSGQCTLLCASDTDCTFGTMKCNAYTFSKPGGGTQIVYACGA